MYDPGHARHLYQRWMEMWNGDLDAASEIFAGDCIAHPAPTTTGEPPVFHGPNEMGRAIFSGVRFKARG